MSTFLDASRQLQVLLSGGANAIPPEDLERKLRRSIAEGRPLRVKLGIDPSAPDLHLGHSVVLGALRRFQDLGHIAVLIVGDFTGRVGDPTGQSETRPMLGAAELEGNAQTYLDQAAHVLDVQRAEIRHNSEWLAPLTFADVARLASALTVARLLERDDFSQRYRSGQAISLAEFLYPLMQGYDSVAVQADVEIGGNDQTFNLLVGRDIQRQHGLEPQVVFTLPLLVGTDGNRKMSKSFGNHVGLTDPPEEQFGRTMRIPDELIVPWFRLCTGLPPEELDEIERRLADGSIRPDLAKRWLAGEIVRRYQGDAAAAAAVERFDRVFREHHLPDDVPTMAIPGIAVRNGSVWLPRLLSTMGLAASNAEARRLIVQGGVRLEGEALTDPDTEFAPEDLAGKIVQVGRRRFVRLGQ